MSVWWWSRRRSRGASDAAQARRAQILATEHWGLLAARSTAQNEVLTRITIFLTLVSASLVTLGLLGQVTDFADWFGVASLSILGFLCVIGFMTQTRVLNASEEDMMYVIAMNRLRAAYVDLDPEVAQYFLAGIADDRAGMQRSYSFLRRRSFSHVFGSSAMLIMVVNGCVFGLTAGALVAVPGGSPAVATGVGVTLGLLVVAASVHYAGFLFRRTWRRYRPLRRTIEADPPVAD